MPDISLGRQRRGNNCVGAHVAWNLYFSAMTFMTSLSGLRSSRYSARIVDLNCSQASAGTCSRDGRDPAA